MGEPVTEAAAGDDPVGPDAVKRHGRRAKPVERTLTAGRLGGILVKVVSWAVLIVCGALIVGFVLVPRLTGSTPYTVLTGSMRPGMPPGTTVVVKPIAFSDIRVGDVITYQIESGKPDVVTHRVIGVNVTADGVRLETQGDANPQPDPELVREEQVRGKAWYWLPVIGYVTNGVTSDTRTWLAQGLGVGLIGYAVVTLVVTAVRGGKKRAEATE
ncbi:MAG: signal peptidase I, partial [Mycetocola sp.]